MPSELSRELRAQSALFVRAVRTTFAYKPALFLSMTAVAISSTVPLLVWSHVCSVRREPLALPANQLFSYLILAACLNFVFAMGVELRVGQRIRLGLIATDLLKPADFQLLQLTQSLAELLMNMTIVLPFVGLAYGLWGSAALPAGPGALAAFLLSACLAFLIQFATSFIFVQAAFFTFSTYGVFFAKNALQLTFAGVSAPLALFPPPLRLVAEYLPFCHGIHTPVSIYLGALSGAAMWHALAVQAAWAFGMLIVGRGLLRWSLLHLEIQGG
jgi:ABC-2 type transport system permease protein